MTNLPMTHIERTAVMVANDVVFTATTDLWSEHNSKLDDLVKVWRLAGKAQTPVRDAMKRHPMYRPTHPDDA